MAIRNDDALAADAKEIQLEINAEAGFDPLADVDVAALTFGAPRLVDYGKGGRALKSAPSGKNLVVTFSAADAGFDGTDFAAKLLGKTAKGDLLFGYAKLPGRTDPQPILVPRHPALSRAGDGKLAVSVQVENFGQAASAAGICRLVFKQKGAAVHTVSAEIPGLAPCAGAAVSFAIDGADVKAQETYDIECVISPDRPDAEFLATRGVQVP